MQNRYEHVPPDERNIRPNEHHDDYLRRMVEGSRHDAWNEGSASRDAEVTEHCEHIAKLATTVAEQAEIVSGLVGALQSYVISCGNTAHLAPREGVQKAYTLAKKALAKAKGE